MEQLIVSPDGYVAWPDVRERVLEPKLGKSINELTTPIEIVSAFEALPEAYYGAFAPDLLYQLWRQRQLTDTALRTDAALRQLLLEVWRYADFPTVGCPARAWRTIFAKTGFLSDGLARPTRARALYRGCTAHGRRGMCWTANRYTAEKFLHYWFENQQAERLGNLYKTIAPPRAILGAIRGNMENVGGVEMPVQGEQEFIVDARLLPINLVETGRQWAARIEREEARLQSRWRRLKARLPS
jgi:hypothetical protein